MQTMDNTTGSIIMSSPDMTGDHTNMLLSDTYVLRVGETLQGTSKVLVPRFRPRNHIRGNRQFFIRFDNGKTWNVNQDMVRHPEATYSVVHALHQTTLESAYEGLKTQIRVFVPQTTTAEIWTLTFRNTTDETLAFSLFSSVDFEHGGVMESQATYDPEIQGIISHTFPYHVSYDDKAWLERVIPAMIGMRATKEPAGYSTSFRRFMGSNRSYGVPASVLSDRCDNKDTTSPETSGILHHTFTLPPAQSGHVHIVIAVHTDRAALNDDLLSWNDTTVREAHDATRRFTERLKDRLSIETPDKAFDHKFNGWFKKQLFNMSVNNRMSAHYPIRNVLQDAMGYALIDPDHARAKLIEILSTQSSDGSVRQWQHLKGTGPNGLARLSHSDGPVWLVLAGVSIIEQTGDLALFNLPVTYDDGPVASIRDHLLEAVIHMSRSLGPHGLVLMKDGDWTDPINGIGRRGTGESTWNTLATIVAADRLSPYLDEADKTAIGRIKNDLADAFRTHALKDTHIIAGFDDEGRPFGDDGNTHGKRYLNVHTWALMTDILTEKQRMAVRAVIDALDTPVGPVLMDPPYMDYDPQVGRISLKKPGTTENGSVYNHAAMFKAYAESLSGDPDAALDTILKIMPDNPDNPNRDLQIPTYVPNYVFGLRDSPDFGRSSLHDSTGTTAWFYWVMVESVLGIRAGINGLEVLDIPATRWPTVRLTRTFKGTTYNILIRQGDAFTVSVDGIPLQSPVLPNQTTTCHVVVERRVT